MQKRIIGDSQPVPVLLTTEWLNLETLAELEISSEHADYPIEAALLPGFSHGWRAGESGKQTIRLLFKQAQPIHGIELDFLESAIGRTQEYDLRISEDNGKSFVEIVRQQWNFNPQGSTTESERHIVNFPDTNIIELNITPDINDPNVIASLEKLRVF